MQMKYLSGCLKFYYQHQEMWNFKQQTYLFENVNDSNNIFKTVNQNKPAHNANLLRCLVWSQFHEG